MANTANVIGTMEGIFKKVYAPRVKYAYPNGVMIVRDIPFGREIGDSYNQPVTLQFETGFTLAAPAAGSFTISDPEVGITKNASVDGYQIVLSSEIDYESAAKASKSGEKAFVRATRHVVRNMTDSHRKMLEIQALYGRCGIGVVESCDQTANTIKITKASWAPAIWSGWTGVKLQLTSSDKATARVTPATCQVSAVNMSTRVITVNNVPTGVTPGDLIFLAGAIVAGTTPTYKENVGIVDALDTSGSVWGINNSTYSLWKSPEIDAGGEPLRFDIIQTTAARVAEQGGIGGRLRLYVSHLTFVDLVGDEAALRRYGKDDGSARYVTGAEKITFHTAVGPVEVVPSIYIKRGIALMLNLSSWTRTGAQDFAFGDPIDKAVFHRLESKAGADMRSYSNVSIFSDALGQNALITNIVDSTAA